MEKNTHLVDVVILPTEKASSICKDNVDNTINLTNHKELVGRFSFQNLYFTSTEEIKEGDWYVLFANDKPIFVLKCTGDGDYFDAKKIVATTNPDLWFIGNVINNGKAFSNKILIPKIDTTFLKTYVNAYNAGTPITQVNLEQEDITICEGVYDIHGNLKKYKNKVTGKKLKLRNDGSVIVHPVVEKTYTQKEMDEVLDALNICFKSLMTYGKHPIIEAQIKPILQK